MLRILFILLIEVAIIAISPAQSPYSFPDDPKNPGSMMLYGEVSKYLLINDSSFSWYAQNQKGYRPQSQILSAVENAKDSVEFLVFAGTWCDDSQFILPRFFRLLELSGFPYSRVRFFAVDRNKKSPDGNAGKYNIERVPTIIVLKSGMETGRIVEYGLTGNWDQELGAMLK